MAEWLSGGCKVSVKPEKFERAAALCLYTTILCRALKHTLKAQISGENILTTTNKKKREGKSGLFLLLLKPSSFGLLHGEHNSINDGNKQNADTPRLTMR